MINKSGPLIQVNNVTKIFNQNLFRSSSPSISNINLTIHEGETVGLVGHSGSGKSTLGKILIRLIYPSFGDVLYQNQNIFKLSRRQFKPFRKDLQMVFQNPLLSFNRMFTVSQILSEGLRLYNICDRRSESDMIDYLLNLTELKLSVKTKYPYELSGGECQRVSIARSLSVNPKFIVFDESTSALDVLVAKKIIKTIKEIQQKTGLTYLFISHNIGLVKEISNNIIVMDHGKIVESGPPSDIYYNPSHPYTKKLISAFQAQEK